MHVLFSLMDTLILKNIETWSNQYLVNGIFESQSSFPFSCKTSREKKGDLSLVSNHVPVHVEWFWIRGLTLATKKQHST